MALTIPYTDQSGNAYTASYWFASTIRTDSVNYTIDTTFTGWKDIASFEAGKQPISGGFKTYRVSGADFQTIATAAPVGSTLYAVLAHAAENFALTKLDTPSKDADGNPVMVSFFDGAAQS